MIDSYQLQQLQQVMNTTGMVLQGVQKLSEVVVSQQVWPLLDDEQKKRFADAVLEATLADKSFLSGYMRNALSGKETELFERIDLDIIGKALSNAAVSKISSSDYDVRTLIDGAVKKIGELVGTAAENTLRLHPDLLMAQVVEKTSAEIVNKAVQEYARRMVEAVKDKVSAT